MSFMRAVACAVLMCFSVAQADGIAGIYLTHKGTEGGQSVVEIFEYNGQYYVYGLKNLQAAPIADSCNKNPELRERKSVGNVFGYGYTKNEKGQFVGGLIYNFYNCKTYYGKIVPKGKNTIDFVGALDSYYVLSRAYEWRRLNANESEAYRAYQIPLEKLITTIHDTKRSKK